TVLAVAIGGQIGQESQSSPAVVYQPYGTGRVVVIEGAGMWRWAFLPPQYQQGEEVYASLWHSLLRWLVSGGQLLPGQKMTLRAEELDLKPRPDLMARLATESGGAVLDADAAGNVKSKFEEHWAKLHPPRYERTTAWDRGWVIAAVFAAWTAAWAIRRSGGLV